LRASVYGLRVQGSRRALLRRGWILMLSWSQARRGHRLRSLRPLTFDHQGLSTAVQPPPCEPYTPRAGEAVCLVVSCHLCDPIEGATGSASRLLNELAPWDHVPTRALGSRWVGRHSGHRLLVQVLAQVGTGLESGSSCHRSEARGLGEHPSPKQ
jgi:hypothetical protein